MSVRVWCRFTIFQIFVGFVIFLLLSREIFVPKPKQNFGDVSGRLALFSPEIYFHFHP